MKGSGKELVAVVLDPADGPGGDPPGVGVGAGPVEARPLPLVHQLHPEAVKATLEEVLLHRRFVGVERRLSERLFEAGDLVVEVERVDPLDPAIGREHPAHELAEGDVALAVAGEDPVAGDLAELGVEGDGDARLEDVDAVARGDGSGRVAVQPMVGTHGREAEGFALVQGSRLAALNRAEVERRDHFAVQQVELLKVGSEVVFSLLRIVFHHYLHERVP